MPARDVLRHSARRHILWRWHPAPHAATPARQARSVGVHPGSLLAVKPLKTDFLSVTADAPLVTTRIGSFEEISGNRGEEKTRPASGPPSDTPAAPRLPELGDRQHQPHQIHLPGDRQFLVDLLQVPVSGAFREPRRQGHVAYALPTRRALARDAAGLVNQGRGGRPVGIVERGVVQRRQDALERGLLARVRQTTLVMRWHASRTMPGRMDRKRSFATQQSVPDVGEAQTTKADFMRS